MSALTYVTPAKARPSAAAMRDALDSFWYAHNLAEEFRDRLTPAQLAGVVDVPAGLEYWDGEARARFEALLSAFGIGLDGVIDDDQFGPLSDLYGRPPLRDTVATGSCDWFKGRAA